MTGAKPLEHSDAVDHARCATDADDDPPLFHSTGLFPRESSQVYESMPQAMVGTALFRGPPHKAKGIPARFKS